MKFFLLGRGAYPEMSSERKLTSIMHHYSRFTMKRYVGAKAFGSVEYTPSS